MLDEILNLLIFYLDVDTIFELFSTSKTMRHTLNKQTLIQSIKTRVYQTQYHLKITFWAAENGNFQVLDWIKRNPCYGLTSKLKQEALLAAATTGQLSTVKILVQSCVNIHFNKCEAFRWSAAEGHEDVFVYLLEHGAEPQADDNFALRWSARGGHLNIVKRLIGLGVSCVRSIRTGINLSAQNKHRDVAKYLFRQLPLLMSRFELAEYYILTGRETKFKELINLGTINLETRGPELLQECIGRNRFELVKFMYLELKDFNILNGAFLVACKKGNRLIAEFLLDQGADPNYMDRAALRFAVQWGCLPIVKLLVDHGATVTNDIVEIAYKMITEGFWGQPKDVYTYLKDVACQGDVVDVVTEISEV